MDERFEEERLRLSELIGDLLDEIHHVGSTSVYGLSAKPKIDIDTVLRSEAAVLEAVRRVKALPDLAFHDDPYDDGMWTFTSGSWGTGLYLCAPGNATHIKRILFRDRLRADPADAEAYADLKSRLAKEADGYWKFYTGGKSEFVARIVERRLPKRQTQGGQPDKRSFVP